MLIYNNSWQFNYYCLVRDLYDRPHLSVHQYVRGSKIVYTAHKHERICIHTRLRNIEKEPCNSKMCYQYVRGPECRFRI